MGDINTISNIYWSLRRFIYEMLPSILTVYAPNQQSIPDVNSWIEVNEMDTPRLDRITVTNYRIHCIVRNNIDNIAMQDLTTQVINVFESSTSTKMIIVYDKQSNAIVGRMFAYDLRSRPSISYDNGITVKPIDITLRYLSNRHA